MLHVVTWFWGSKYSPKYVERLACGVLRNLKEEHRFFVAGPKAEDAELTKAPGCFCRLRMFDPQWQFDHGVKFGDRLVCLDLDNVITGPLDPLFYRPEPFLILQGANASNPCPFNGSVMMLRAGAHAEVWSDFSLDAAAKVPFHEFPDDQGWIAHKLPKAAGWKAGKESGIYGFHKPGWPKGSDDLPEGASIVSFFGKRDPSQFEHLSWVKEHWRA